MSTSALKITELGDGIVSLSLQINADKPRGGVVVLDAWLVHQIHIAIDHIESMHNLSGFILESASERVFVAGADLSEIDALDDGALHGYLKRAADAFWRIAALPCPSAAIIGKAALGGGLEIAMHCDGLIGVASAEGAKPHRIGLPEAGLGICPGWGGTQCLPARIDPLTAIKATATGETFASNALPSCLFNAVSPSAETARATASAWLRSQTKQHPIRCIRGDQGLALPGVAEALAQARKELPQTPSAIAVCDLVQFGLDHGWSAACERERHTLVGLRHTPQAREKLAGFLKK
jgi:3-hydroxyacyl-CoA dehydrogenase/enoyl-CoA hydratase/3-hydroxybutyryl-CoA epimerase